MSHYLPLRPLGDGTTEVESLASFVLRAAATHGVSVTQFVRHLSDWALRNAIIDEKLSFNVIHGGFGCTALAGYNPQIHRFIAALERGFGHSQFRRCTLLALAGAVSNQPMCIRSTRAWCPACMHEAVKAGETYYDQLLWAIALQQRCPAHRLRLTTNCPACGMPQKYGHRSGNLLICWRCEAELIYPSKKWEPDLEPSYGEKHCIELVSAIAKGTFVQAHPEAVAAYRETHVQTLSRPTKRSVVGLRGYRLVRSTFTHGQQRLDVLIRVADDEGISLLDLLNAPVETAQREGGLRLDLAAVARTDSEPQGLEERFDSAIEQALRAQISAPDTDHVPGWEAVAKRFLVCHGYLIKHHRALMRRLGHRRMSEHFRAIHANVATVAREVAVRNILPNLLLGRDDGMSEWLALCSEHRVGPYWRRHALTAALEGAGFVRARKKRGSRANGITFANGPG